MSDPGPAALAPRYLGNLQEFRPETELFSAYMERVKLFFTANAIAEDKQVAHFLTIVGSKTYALLRNLVAPTLPQDKSWDDLVAILKQHYEPKPLVIAERFHFHKRNQAVGESIAEYMAELRKLSTHCEFGTYLNEALRDRLVCGIREVDTQRKLLAVVDLTLKKAMEMAQGAEAAMKNSRSLKEGETRVNLVNKVCRHCGKTSHQEKDCRYKDADCHNCGKHGHIAPICRSKPSTKAKPTPSKPKEPRHPKKGAARPTKYLAAEGEPKGPDTEFLPLHHVGGANTPPIKVPLYINGVEHYFELDTGASVTIMPQEVCRKLFPRGTMMRKSSLLLKTYSGESIPVLGELDVDVQYEQQQHKLRLAVVAGEGPSLLGRDWLNHVKLNWREIKAMSTHAAGSWECLLEKYGELFADDVGNIESFTAKLYVDPTVPPKFFKPRTLPYALRGPVGEKLDQLERDGILEKVTHSEWATPIVAVAKADGGVRLCGDFSVTVNPALQVDSYPLPKAEDLFATLAGGKKFSKLDLSQAYLQLALDPDATEYCTINTHQGLYRFNRLPFGIASAPAIFQRVMDTILQGLPGTICYIDDILLTAASEEEHFRLLEEVLRRLRAENIRMKRSKCYFMRDSVEYLGHIVDANGLHATPEKIAAIERAPRPQNVTQLRSFLGLLNYYRKFLPNLAATIQPLNDLLQKDKKTLELDQQVRPCHGVRQEVAADVKSPGPLRYLPSAQTGHRCAIIWLGSRDFSRFPRWGRETRGFRLQIPVEE